MINAALRGDLDHVAFSEHPIFRVAMPESCPDVPGELLDPVRTWTDSDAYGEQARRLADMFRDNFSRFGDSVGEHISSAGPRTE